MSYSVDAGQFTNTGYEVRRGQSRYCFSKVHIFCTVAKCMQAHLPHALSYSRSVRFRFVRAGY